MAIAIIEARRRAAENRDRLQRLEQRHAALVARCADEELRQDVLRARIHRELLAPFAGTFSRLRNVRLAEFADVELPGVPTMPVIDVVSDLDAILGMTDALFDGTWWGAATGHVTRACFGSGGPPLGLGLLPGLLVGTGVVTARGRRDLRDQDRVEGELARADARWDQEQARVDAVLRRAEHLRDVLRRLLEAGLDRLPAVTATIEELDDVRLWSAADRARVAAVVGLVVVASTLMRAPFVDRDGAVADRDGGALADAHRWLRAHHDGRFG